MENIWCWWFHYLIINLFMYADEVVICYACRADLQHLLCISFQCGAGSDKRFNAEQCSAMIIRWNEDNRPVFPEFCSSGDALEVSSEVKYLVLINNVVNYMVMETHLYSHMRWTCVKVSLFTVCSADLKTPSHKHTLNTPEEYIYRSKHLSYRVFDNIIILHAVHMVMWDF